MSILPSETDRGSLGAETLLRIVLILVVVWIILEVVGIVFGELLGPLRPLLGIAVIVLIVLWLTDRL